MNFLKGYKAYAAAAGLFLFAAYGLTTGHLTADQAIPLMLNALAVFGLRNAL